MQAATSTADGAITYDKPMRVFGNQSVLEVANALREKHCETEGWEKTALRPGAYELDTLIYTVDSVNSFLMQNASDPRIRMGDVAEVIHNAWCTIYHFWKTNEPWKREDTRFFAPDKGFTERHTDFWNLDYEERAKDFTLAQLLIDMM